MLKRLLKDISGKKPAASFSVMLLFEALCLSQPSVMSFVEAGQNNIYDKGYFSFSISPSYTLHNDFFSAGVLFTAGGQRENNLGGCYLDYARSFSIFNQAFSVSGFYLWVPFSNELRETDWGITLSCKLPHFRFTLGNNYRTYRFSRAYIRSDESTTGAYRITEPGNLIYSFRYNLRNEEEPWNLMFSVTNNDYYLFEQETNPMVILNGSCRIADNLTSFIDLGYKSAGLLCIKVDYFGCFLRFGIKWDILRKEDI
jgi:hypothetical protein